MKLLFNTFIENSLTKILFQAVIYFKTNFFFIFSDSKTLFECCKTFVINEIKQLQKLIISILYCPATKVYHTFVKHKQIAKRCIYFVSLCCNYLRKTISLR